MRKLNRGFVVLVAVALLGAFALAQVTTPPATGPATAPGTGPATKAARSPEDIGEDFKAAGIELNKVMTSPKILRDAKARTEAAPKVVPLLKKMVALLDELVSVEPMAGPQVARTQQEIKGMLAVFDDAETVEALKKVAAGEGAKAIEAQLALIQADLMRSDAKTQEKPIAALEALAKKNPESTPVLIGILSARYTVAGRADRERLEKLILETMKGPNIEQAKGMIAPVIEMRKFEGKPLVLDSVLVDGKKFSTADWKGKVVLIDFWATWCGPCLQELPNVKKLYADNHGKGLEIIGVSCDEEAKDLTEFLGQNKDMPWPHFFDAAKPGWHELANKYSVKSIPTMFLIDRKGILRSVEARSDYEELVPQLLAEKAE